MAGWGTTKGARHFDGAIGPYDSTLPHSCSRNVPFDPIQACARLSSPVYQNSTGVVESQPQILDREDIGPKDLSSNGCVSFCGEGSPKRILVFLLVSLYNHQTKKIGSPPQKKKNDTPQI